MVADAEKYRQLDAEIRVTFEAKNELESYIYNAKKVVSYRLTLAYTILLS